MSVFIFPRHSKAHANAHGRYIDTRQQEKTNTHIYVYIHRQSQHSSGIPLTPKIHSHETPHQLCVYLHVY